MNQPVTGRWRTPVIVGERVTLRPITVADAEAMWEEVTDPEGHDLTATAATFTRDQVEAWCAGRESQDDRLDLAIVDHQTGEYAGEVVLNEHDPETGSANIRIALRGPAWWGRGLGSEATRRVVDHGLRTVGLERITLAVLARNPRARRVYEKAGFRTTRTYVEDGEDWVEMEVRRSRLDPDYPVLTERLLLRPVDPARDTAAMHSYRSRDDVCRYVPFEPGTLEQMADRLADPERTRSVIDAEGQVLALMVERRDTGEVIGDLVLFWHSAADGHAEIGYVLHPDHAGRGFATEAAAALVGLAFERARRPPGQRPDGRAQHRLGRGRRAARDAAGGDVRRGGVVQGRVDDAAGLRPAQARVGEPARLSARRRLGANALVPSHPQKASVSRVAPTTRTSRDRTTSSGNRSPTHTSVSASTLDSTTRVRSWPGSSRQSSARPDSTTSHQSCSRSPASGKWKNTTTRRSPGTRSSRTNRRTSHIRNPTSSRSGCSRLPIHSAPQWPMASTIGRSASPAGVSSYDVDRPDTSRRTTPDSSRLRSRAASSVVDIRGSPRRSSLKWVLPHSSSRITSSVQRSPSTSAPRATVQNCP